MATAATRTGSLAILCKYRYVFGTWTNGLVVVSYSTDLLGASLTDYAFAAAAAGGSKFGATVDNTCTPSNAGAPSVRDQITNYTGSPHAHFQHSLGFIWIGENDLTSTPMHSGKAVLITHGSPTTSQAILLLKSGPPAQRGDGIRVCRQHLPKAYCSRHNKVAVQ